MKETAYLLQATLISAWWVGLFSSHTFFVAFQYDKIPPTAFWSFFAPDILLIASLTTIRAYRASTSIELIVLGAFGYAALYCFQRIDTYQFRVVADKSDVVGAGIQRFPMFQSVAFSSVKVQEFCSQRI